MTITAMQTVADQLAAAKLGYDQGQRWTYLDKKNRRIIPGGETDCSASCGGIAYLGDYPVDLSGTFYTGNFRQKLIAAGFKAIDASDYKTLRQLTAALRPGDFILGPGHVVFVRDAARWWSAEVDERGKSSGGKAGNQGDHVGYRAPYMRSRGWAWILRPPAETVSAPKPVTVSADALFRFLHASQESPRFGGSTDYAARGRALAAAKTSIITITELTPAMLGGILAALGPKWASKLHSAGTVGILYRADKWTPKQSRESDFGDRYHGAVALPLVHKATGLGIDVIAAHIRPKSVATTAQKRADVAKSLALVGTWPAILAGDWAMDPDELMAAKGFVRATPDVDTYDKAGDQRIDAVYVAKAGPITVRASSVVKSGAVSDHDWLLAQLTRTK